MIRSSEIPKPSMILSNVPSDAGRARGLWAIGFWKPTEEQTMAVRSMNDFLLWLGKRVLDETSDLPSPQDFVDPSWDPAERAVVIAYLRKGRVLTRYMGYSTCRFKCGIDDAQMGDADLTDGTFVWPEGFSHYLEKHNVRPGQNFVDHVRRVTTGAEP